MKITLFKFRIVLCRIRLFPTMVSKMKWLGSGLPLKWWNSLFLAVPYFLTCITVLGLLESFWGISQVDLNWPSPKSQIGQIYSALWTAGPLNLNKVWMHLNRNKPVRVFDSVENLTSIWRVTVKSDCIILLLMNITW